jgi:hypothetical protein
LIGSEAWFELNRMRSGFSQIAHMKAGLHTNGYSAFRLKGFSLSLPSQGEQIECRRLIDSKTWFELTRTGSGFSQIAHMEAGLHTNGYSAFRLKGLWVSLPIQRQDIECYRLIGLEPWFELTRTGSRFSQIAHMEAGLHAGRYVALCLKGLSVSLSIQRQDIECHSLIGPEAWFELTRMRSGFSQIAHMEAGLHTNGYSAFCLKGFFLYLWSNGGFRLRRRGFFPENDGFDWDKIDRDPVGRRFQKCIDHEQKADVEEKREEKISSKLSFLHGSTTGFLFA